MLATMSSEARKRGRPKNDGAVKVTVAARIDPTYAKKLKDMAGWDRRDRSGMIELIIRDYVDAHYDEMKAKHGKAK